MASRLYFILPGLIPHITRQHQGPLSLASLQSPALSKCLSKAKLLSWRANNIEAVIKSYVAGFDQHELPIGALGALAHQYEQSQSAHWLRADPIYLQADHQHVYCQPPKQLPDPMLQTLVAALNQFLAQDNCQIVMHNAQQWYLRTPHSPQISCNALWECIGREIHDLLPSGPDAPIWHRLLTECQMLIENTRRGLTDMPPLSINGLWFWGNGPCPQQLMSNIEYFWSDEPYIKGIAQLAQRSSQALPKGLVALMQLAQTHTSVSGEHLIFDLQCHLSWQSGDYLGWQAAIEAYEQNWFTPLLDLISANTIDEAVINLADGREYVLNKHYLRYFWRKNRKFTDLIYSQGA
jgi:hypothetical protein